MSKAKAKKRFVIGEGYPFLDWVDEEKFVNLQLWPTPDYDDPNHPIDLNNKWPGEKLGNSKYRLVLEEI